MEYLVPPDDRKLDDSLVFFAASVAESTESKVEEKTRLEG